MNAPADPSHPQSDLAASIGAELVRTFEHHNGRARGSQVVHAVALVEWLGGFAVPVAGCGTGVGGWQLQALHPVDSPVSCLRCLRSPRARRAAAAHDPAQLELDVEWEVESRHDE